MNKKGLLLAISTISCVAMIGSSLLISKRFDSQAFAINRGAPSFDNTQSIDSTNFQYVSSQYYDDPDDYVGYVDFFRVVNTGSGDGFIDSCLSNDDMSVSAYTPVAGKLGTFSEFSYLMFIFDWQATSLKSITINFEDGGDVQLAGIVDWNENSNWFCFISDAVEPGEPITLVNSMDYGGGTYYTPTELMLSFNADTTITSISISYSC